MDYDLKDYLRCDSKSFIEISGREGWIKRWKRILFADPISDQRYIWSYIYYLRHTEYSLLRYQKRKSIYTLLLKIYYLYKLRKISYITGFQIPPFTCGKGLTIYHMGSIIINGKARLGDNCTLYPGVLIGWKGPEEQGCAQIGDNVFVGSGTKIIGGVKIGNNVILGQNLVVTKDIPDNAVVVVESKYRFLNNQNWA